MEENRIVCSLVYYSSCSLSVKIMPISLRFYSSLIKCSRQNYSSIRKTKPKIQLESEEVRESKPVHVLRNPYPWKTKEQFVDHLAANVIYNKGNLWLHSVL